MKNLATALLSLALGTTLMSQDPIPEDKDKKTLPSGLEYSILQEGSKDGRRPRLGDEVTVHYTGWLENGTVFDSSRTKQPPNPAKFKVGQVIEGWNEGLGYLTPGGKIKLTIPSHLAYGEAGSPPRIPANAKLIFEVELLDVAAGPELPAFQALTPENSKTTDSGCKYEILVAGEGDVAGPDDTVQIQWALFSVDGKFVDGSALNGQDITAAPARLNLPALKEFAQMVPEKGIYLIECPASQTFRGRPYRTLAANADSIWRLEVKAIKNRIPKFAAVDAAKAKALDGGLLVETVKEGMGEAPTKGQTVNVHYAGWLTNGTSFDSSYGRGTPFSFTVGSGVIEGWSQSVQHMKPGGIYRVSIPPTLGYGERPAGTIPPNSTLIFQIEVLSVAK